MPATLQKSNKVFCFTFILFITQFKLSGQSLALLGGVSQPVLLYGSSDVTLKDAGFAKPGNCYSLQFEDTRKLRTIGYWVQLTYNSNNVDAEAIEKFARARVGQGINVQAVSSWQQVFVGGGPKVSINRERYSLFTGMLAGINWLNSAAYNQFDSVTLLKQKRLNANSFGIIANAGASFSITSQVSLVFNASYYYTAANYGTVKLTDSNGNVVQEGANLEVPVQNIMFQAGMIFNLSKPKNLLKEK